MRETEEANPKPRTCARCGLPIGIKRGDYFLVSIDAIRDPSPLILSRDEMELDATAEIKRLIERLKGMTERQALDQVFRQRVIELCVHCLEFWIENPISG
jgi:hypothetical protein